MEPPSFREQMIADFYAVLANTEEYGGVHLFNGREIQMVVAAAPAENLAYYAGGVLQEAKEIICTINDMPAPPRTTEAVTLDGVQYFVDGSRVEFVFVHVTLVRQSS